MIGFMLSDVTLEYDLRGANDGSIIRPQWPSGAEGGLKRKGTIMDGPENVLTNDGRRD